MLCQAYAGRHADHERSFAVRAFRSRQRRTVTRAGNQHASRYSDGSSEFEGTLKMKRWNVVGHAHYADRNTVWSLRRTRRPFPLPCPLLHG